MRRVVLERDTNGELVHVQYIRFDDVLETFDNIKAEIIEKPFIDKDECKKIINKHLWNLEK